MNTQAITETVSKFFIAVDQRNWDEVQKIFNDTVLLDYTSMAGGEPADLASQQIIDAWKGLLPGFDQTHHQLGNFIVEADTEIAKVFCYGTATHYLENETMLNVWTVVGTYDLELQNMEGNWRISKMKFNLKYFDGNNALPGLAHRRLSEAE